MAAVLAALACTGAYAVPQESGTMPAGAPVTSQPASNPQDAETQSSVPQSTGTQSSVPRAEGPQAPVEKTVGNKTETNSRELTAAPMIQFSISISTVNFGGGLLAPQASPYTQSFTTTVNSNTSWRISVTRDHDLQGVAGTIPSANFTFSAAGPAGKTTYQAPAGTSFGANVRAVDGARGSSLVSTITYGLVVSWSVQADAYSATHIYTAMSI